MSIHILGVDLGKNICSLAGLDAAGAVIFRKRIQRHRLLAVLSQIPRCVVAMGKHPLRTTVTVTVRNRQ